MNDDSHQDRRSCVRCEFGKFTKINWILIIYNFGTIKSLPQILHSSNLQHPLQFPQKFLWTNNIPPSENSESHFWESLRTGQGKRTDHIFMVGQGTKVSAVSAEKERSGLWLMRTFGGLSLLIWVLDVPMHRWEECRNVLRCSLELHHI